MSDVKLVEAPPGIEGSGFFATSMEKVVGLARSHSLWPLPFATSCCGIEFMATMGSHYDFARFGSERPLWQFETGKYYRVYYIKFYPLPIILSAEEIN